MALHYAKVLHALGQRFEVVGRSEASADTFETSSGLSVRRGGLATALSELGAPDRAIVSVGVDQLSEVASALVEGGTGRLLVEKPAGVNSKEIRALDKTAREAKAEVFVAYNRRYYASVEAIRELVKQDGGISSCRFEITEYSDTIVKLDYPSAVTESWFLANTSHVVDLVISLCGVPAQLSSQAVGTLPWHPAAAQFVGSGVTDSGIVFSYHGDWEAPGRWGIEICTRKCRYVLQPLEQLHVVRDNSATREIIKIDERLDKEFKPGLFLQTAAFLDGDDRLACELTDHVRNCEFYDKMADYSLANERVSVSDRRSTAGQ